MEEFGFDHGLALLQSPCSFLYVILAQKKALLFCIDCLKIDFPFTGIRNVLLEVGDDYVQWLEIGLTSGT